MLRCSSWLLLPERGCECDLGHEVQSNRSGVKETFSKLPTTHSPTRMDRLRTGLHCVNSKVSGCVQRPESDLNETEEPRRPTRIEYVEKAIHTAHGRTNDR